VALALGERDLLAELAQRPVDAHADEAAATERIELGPVLALAVANHRRIEKQPRVCDQRQQAIDDLLHGLRRDLAAALVADRVPHAREQEPQVVGDLGHRADRRARVPSHALLLDGDRRREALDAVAVRLLHLLEELTRVCGERLDVAPLPLRVERVEGE